MHTYTIMLQKPMQKFNLIHIISSWDLYHLAEHNITYCCDRTNLKYCLGVTLPQILDGWIKLLTCQADLWKLRKQMLQSSWSRKMVKTTSEWINPEARSCWWEWINFCPHQGLVWRNSWFSILKKISKPLKKEMFDIYMFDTIKYL